MTHIARLAALTLAVILSFGLAGCGPGISTKIDTVEILRKEGLVAELKTNKDAYSQGEAVRIKLCITNTGTKTRALEFRHDGDDAASPTYDCHIIPSGDSYGTWRMVSKEQSTVQIAPGEEFLLMDIAWGQKSEDGTPASPGEYDVRADIRNLYVDGKKLYFHVAGQPEPMIGFERASQIQIR
jgi:hypothetical protein